MSNEFDVSGYRLEDGSGNIVLEDGSGKYLLELQGYFGLVAADGAVGFWPLYESSAASPAVDLMGGNNGTYMATPTVGVTGPLVGETATATAFANNTQQVQVAGATSYAGAPTGSLTVECWARLDAANGGGTMVDLDATLWGLTARVDAGGTNVETSVTATNAAGGALFLSALNNQRFIPMGTWHHFVLTIDGSAATGTSWIDASDEVSPGISGPVPSQPMNGTPKAFTSNQLIIGATDAGTVNGFNGGLALIAIYPTALTRDQIARHYRCGLQFLPDIPPPVRLAAH